MDSNLKLHLRTQRTSCGLRIWSTTSSAGMSILETCLRKTWRRVGPMKRVRIGRALVACWLLLPTVLVACTDANPSPTPPPPQSTAQPGGPTPAPTGASGGPATPTNAAGPGGAATVEAGPAGTSTGTGSAFQPGPCTFHEWLTVETSCGTLTVPEDHRQ